MITQTIIDIVAVVLAAASVYFAVWASRRANWFKQSLKYRNSVISTSVEILNDSDAPDRAKVIATLLRALVLSPKLMRRLSQAAERTKIEKDVNVYDGIPARYSDRLSAAIKQLAYVAMLDDPAHARRMSALIDARHKPTDTRVKEAEIAAIKKVVSIQVREQLEGSHHNSMYAAC